MTIISAHRGFSAKFPENTLIAFQKAIEVGADSIEIDVHLTKDNIPVICHDERINRTSDGEGYIKDFTVEELKQFNFCISFSDYLEWAEKDDQYIRIMTLEELLIWSLNHNFILNIELKNNVLAYKGLEETVVKLINQYQLHKRVLISSFNHYSLQKVKQLDKNIKVGAIEFSNIINPGDYCHKNGIDYYHPNYESIDENNIQNCYDNNIQIVSGVVDSPERIKDLLALNLYIITTNQPELAYSIREFNRTKD
ncbi:glycerophosphodiester phosphodiesterase family protein [Facklamia lactis]|uniref:glycerophosphodiester phosphodiesterase family protein n=1 Tax=Facklamia lactis TaxID=2749967 RepID=UPI0018CFAB47|nr:glycerophosphodiester phosphodiesterase family protein [Facklamia lactis]MBG9980378.1 glycerophosphodiester phosphodiesterase [Facklamia lactis]